MIQIPNDILESIDQNDKVILYPSSCGYSELFQELPYDGVILNSKAFGGKLRKGKVYCLDFDNNELIGLLAAKSIRVSAMVIIRDGCVEGGNYECIAREGFFGRLMPVMTDRFDIFCDHGEFPLNIPANFIEFESPAFLEPIIKNSSPLSRVIRSFHLKPFSIIEKDTILGRIRVRVIWDSIWSSFAQLDLLVIKTKGSSRNSIPNYLEGRVSDLDFINKVEFINVCRTRSIKRILEKTNAQKLSSIAFIPIADGSYKRMVDEIRAWEGDFPKEISFFHLNEGDYQYIISLARS